MRLGLKILGVLGALLCICIPAFAQDLAADPEAQQLFIRLKNNDAETLARAPEILEKMGQRAEKVILALIEATKDEDENVRDKSVRALGSIGAKAEKAVPALIETLKGDKKGWIRSEAAAALGKIGEKAEKAITALTNALEGMTYSDRHHFLMISSGAAFIIFRPYDFSQSQKRLARTTRKTSRNEKPSTNTSLQTNS